MDTSGEGTWRDAAIRLILTPYRDLLIDELQFVQARGNILFSERVQSLMSIALAHRAQRQEPVNGLRALLRGWHGPDDRVEPCDLFLLEATLIQHLTDPAELILRLVTLRELLGSLMTSESYAQVEQHLLPLPKQDRRISAGNSAEQKGCLHSIEALRAEAIGPSSGLYRRIGGLPKVEKIKTWVALVICASTLATVIAGTYVATHYETPYGTLEMACWGAIGAMVSTVERLYRVDPMHEPLKTALSLGAGQFQLMLTPVIGAIFALVLYLLLRGNFVNGVLFPNIHCAELLSRPSIVFLWSTRPATPAICSSLQPDVELGKLLLWGFLAGWAERMVPDVLNKLAPQPSSALKTAGKSH